MVLRARHFEFGKLSKNFVRNVDNPKLCGEMGISKMRIS
jgi:hypothetical protein